MPRERKTKKNSLKQTKTLTAGSKSSNAPWDPSTCPSSGGGSRGESDWTFWPSDLLREAEEEKDLEGGRSLGMEGERGGSLIWMLGWSGGGVFSENFLDLRLEEEDMDLGSKFLIDEDDKVPKNRLFSLASPFMVYFLLV